MQQHSRRYSLGTLSEMNVTPLLDLAFVLLIIFMITAPFLAESADLVIPSSKASREAVDPSQVFTLAINRDHEIELDERPVSADGLAAEILLLKDKNPAMGVVIKAHNLLTVQDLVGVMDMLREADIARVAVVTKPAGEE
jgi:biopolymer transport protein ExbD